MATINILYKDSFRINDEISIRIPTVGEVIDADEDNYYSLVSMLTAMPIDMMVELDRAGIDFTKLDEYGLFLILFHVIKEMDTSLVFGDLDLKAFEPGESEVNGLPVLIDRNNDIVIDRAIAGQIATVLRKINHFEKNLRKPANEEARQYMLERAKAKAKRKKRKHESQLESMVISMVNTEQFPYDFAGVKNLTIYQFNESVRQVVKKINYDNIMRGIYAGTLSAKDVSQKEINWLTHK